MSWASRFGSPNTPSPSTSTTGKTTPSSSQESATPPPIHQLSERINKPPKSLRVSASLSNLKLDKMALSSPISQSSGAGQPEDTPKAKELEFPLEKAPDKPQLCHNEIEQLRELFPRLAARILSSALARSKGDMDTAAMEIMEKHPQAFREERSPSPATIMAAAYGTPYVNVKKEVEATSNRAVKGVIPRITLNLRGRGSLKSEALSSPPHPRPYDIQTSNGQRSSRSGSSYDGDEDTMMSDGSTSRSSVESTAAELQTMFPEADIEECKRIVQCNDGNLQDAFAMMEEDRAGELFLFQDSVMGNSNEAGGSFTTPLHRMPDKLTVKYESGNGRKRAADDTDKRSAKRPLTIAGDLRPAGDFVVDLSTENGGIQLVFDNEKHHPYRFPKKLLTKHFSLLEEMLNTKAERYTINGYHRLTFDLLLQWVIARNIQFEPSNQRTKAREITEILKMVQLGSKLVMVELEALEHSMAHLLTTILTDERKALTGAHIRFAFDNFDASSPIRDVFVRAAVRARIEHIEDPRLQGNARPGDRRGSYANEAQRANAEGHPFPYADEMMDIGDFEIRLLRAFKDTWETRELGKRKEGNKNWTVFWMTDPLSEERFFI